MKFFCIRPIPRFICLIMLVCLGSGCLESWEADYSGIELIPIKGTITLDGEPLPDAVVFFVQENETKSYATTDKNGFYKMKFNSEVDGVLPGNVTVEISTTASTGELKVDEGESDPDMKKKKGEKKELVPAEYNVESQLKVAVTSSDRTFNFDLKPDGSTTGPSK